MSQYYMEHGKRYTPEYEKPGRTKQSFKDSCDVNKIVKKAQKTGTISHLNKHQATYGDLSGFDFTEAQMQLAKAGEIFDDLPSEIRREFDNSPAKFFEFANDVKNVDKLGELLPAIAEPGNFFPSPNKTAATEARRAAETSENEAEVAATSPEVKTPPKAAKEPVGDKTSTST